MTKKSEFMPVVSRIKLNPEQAVLQCACYSTQVEKKSNAYGWFRQSTYGCYTRWHGSTTTKHNTAAICTKPRRDFFSVSECYGAATGYYGEWSGTSS